MCVCFDFYVSLLINRNANMKNIVHKNVHDGITYHVGWLDTYSMEYYIRAASYRFQNVNALQENTDYDNGVESVLEFVRVTAGEELGGDIPDASQTTASSIGSSSHRERPQQVCCVGNCCLRQHLSIC